ncbi:hypothetical protein [Rhodohalobacter sulfatireducens]|uniref:DUF4013 domain-containing protein n=1 Tax=Rhodohalobacter sulfatireducens TaxID=2911366 RepID=A0ABS9KE62_9BACT|nr:hypothetical protein [Rhodohalobacter sulfatireducens]MCG2589125.1 hypothetical protein [Rhodohalobacter sulfatireducens]
MSTAKTFIRVLWAILKVTALSVFIIGVIVILFLLLIEGQDIDVPGSVLSSWLSISGTIILILTLILLSVFLIWLARLIFLRKEVFGSNPVARILGFGVTAIFYSGAVHATITAPIRFIINLFSQLPFALRELTSSVGPGVDYTIDLCSDYFITLILNFGSEIARAVNTLLVALPISDIVIALAIWVFIGQLFSSVSSSTDKISGDLLGKSRVSQFIQNMPKARRMNVLLSGIFFISGYLCIASIVAIPWLQQEESPEVLNTESLEQRLSESLLSLDTIDNRFQQMVSDESDLFEPLRPLLAISIDSILRDTLSTELKNAWDQNVSRIESEITNIQRRRNHFISEWRQFRDQIPNRQNNLLQTAVSDFETNTLAHMSTQERSYYFQNIVRWFQGSISQLQRPVENGLKYLQSQEDLINSWINNVESSLEQDVIRLGGYADDPTIYLDYFGKFGSSYSTDYIFTDYFRLF